MPLSARAPRNQLQLSSRSAISTEAGGSVSGIILDTLLLAHLAFGEQQNQRLAVTIDDRVQLRVQAVFRAPDTAGKSPF
jgi:hypothetical protein